MKRSHKSGLGFGATSGIITPLGLIVGLYSGTESAVIIIGGILTIAIADAFSDSLGVHVSKEADHGYSTREIWEATFATFFSKFFFALIFVVPFLLLHVVTATIASVVFGMGLLAIFSYFISKMRNGNPWLAIGEHVGIGAVVILITYYLPVLIKVWLV
ncbi:hypothetical protein KKA53_03100 [Candidatus Dependentiae bacterium]|nr:hypothetical protein [Candidatus Dependentiae bacterium]